MRRISGDERFIYPFMIYQCSIVCEHEIQRDVLLRTVFESLVFREAAK